MLYFSQGTKKKRQKKKKGKEQDNGNPESKTTVSSGSFADTAKEVTTPAVSAMKSTAGEDDVKAVEEATSKLTLEPTGNFYLTSNGFFEIYVKNLYFLVP